MTGNLEKHQERLEEKQAACLEQIREMEKQVIRTTVLASSRAGLAPGSKGPCSRELLVRRWGREAPLSPWDPRLRFLWGPQALS